MDVVSSGIQPGVVRDTSRLVPVDTIQQRARKATLPNNAPDQVAISGEALMLQKLSASVLESPEDREKKVNALREAVQRGTYAPSALDIAKAILAHEATI